MSSSTAPAAPSIAEVRDGRPGVDLSVRQTGPFGGIGGGNNAIEDFHDFGINILGFHEARQLVVVRLAHQVGDVELPEERIEERVEECACHLDVVGPRRRLIKSFDSYTVAYPFTQTFVPTTYTMRTEMPPQKGVPYHSGSSDLIDVPVRP